MPSAIQRGLYGFSVSQTQEFAILILGSLGFITFLVQEKRLKKNMAEKTVIQRKANIMEKDLKSSYSYIGEINRKLDILENVTISHPESLNMTSKEQKEIFNSVMQAIRLFAKSDEFVLRFFCPANNEIFKEIKSQPNASFGFSLKNFDPKNQPMESNDLITIISPKAIDNILSCVIIKKKTQMQKIEDLEMLRILASHALLLFIFISNKKEFSCNL